MPNADFFALFRLFVVRSFLDADSCEWLRSEVRLGDRSPAQVQQEAGAFAIDRSVRSVQRVRVADTTASLLESRLLAVKPAVERHFNLTLEGCQTLQFLAYQPGDFYRPHRDSYRDPDSPGFVKERRVSVVIFLNSESPQPREGCYCGGSLTFYGLMRAPQGKPLRLPLIGEEGLLIAFPSELTHEVFPVTYGERYTIAAWYF